MFLDDYLKDNSLKITLTHMATYLFLQNSIKTQTQPNAAWYNDPIGLQNINQAVSVKMLIGIETVPVWIGNQAVTVWMYKNQ